MGKRTSRASLGYPVMGGSFILGAAVAGVEERIRRAKTLDQQIADTKAELRRLQKARKALEPR